MLYLQGNDPVRVQCAFVDTPEVEKIAEYISHQQGYPTAFILPEYVDENAESSSAADVDMNRLDPLFEEAARLVIYHQQGSTSLIQRKFSIGYNRAGRIMSPSWNVLAEQVRQTAVRRVTCFAWTKTIWICVQNNLKNQ